MIFTREFRENWPTVNKILFRFLFLYFSLYILFIFSSTFIEAPLRWFANNILHWGQEFKIEITGSGDTTHQWVTLAFNLFVALVGLIFWSVLDRKRPSYNQLFYWFRVVIRIILFFMMLQYGFAKVIKTQFQDPDLIKLLQPIGDMSPMGLAWTFMGYSASYNFFTGLLEIIGGLLVLFRKTKSLGAIIVIGVMLNVAMMNFTFDIPVKIFSVHLILLASIILLTDAKRLVNIFILNKGTEAVNHYSVSEDPTYQKIKFWLKLVMILGLMGLFYLQGTSVVELRKSRTISESVYGIWEANQFIKNNDTIAPSLNQPLRWRYLVLNYKSGVHVKFMNDSVRYYKSDFSEENQTFQFYKNNKDSIPSSTFNYELLNDKTMLLHGILESDTLQMMLVRKDEKEFELINRGFHWVNEYPRNK